MAEEAELDDEQTRAVTHTLGRCTMFESAAPIRVWRECLNTRWVVFLIFGEQTYCLLPLSYSTPATGCLPDQPGEERA